MEIKELRIGNLIYYGESIRKITAIGDSPQRKFIGVDNMITDLVVIKPIPLTPEILKKYKGGTNYFIIGQYFLLQDMGGWHFDYIDDDNRGDRAIAYPNFVHQLQNVYFALTNEELMIEDLELKRSVATKAK